MCSHLIVRK